jgi:hypothetical protein
MKKYSTIIGLLFVIVFSLVIWSCSSKSVATSSSSNISLSIVTGACAVTLYVNGSSFQNIGASSLYNGNYTGSNSPVNVFLVTSSSVTVGNESCQSSYSAVGGTCSGSGWIITAH